MGFSPTPPSTGRNFQTFRERKKRRGREEKEGGGMGGKVERKRLNPLKLGRSTYFLGGEGQRRGEKKEGRRIWIVGIFGLSL